MKRFVRASRVQIHHHPDEGKTTMRMPFAQLRALVVAAIGPDDDDPAHEFDDEGGPTTYHPRTSTLDRVIVSLSRKP